MGHEIILISLACLFGLFLTWSVGANDLANVLSPVLGSKSINLKQAIWVAVIFELGGALLGGGKVAGTIQHGIIDISALANTPQLLTYGMLSALLSSSVWITVATRIGIPVSLTNSVVGSILGFGALALGVHAIHWNMIGWIGLSWLVCPSAAGLLAYSLFLFIQRKILASATPMEEARRRLPFFLFAIGIILTEITLIKGLKHFNFPVPIWENVLLALGCSFFVISLGKVFLKRIYVQPAATYHEQLALVEKSFTVLIMFTACAMVYAHGSDDIATATGPIVAVIGLVTSKSATHNGNLLLSILTMGYVGVIIGFLTFGRRVVQAVGSSITELTPSRAFCATIAAASTVVFSTNIGIPVSATQTLVGAILGVGLARGLSSLDLRIVRNIFTSWLITVPITALLATVFFYLFKRVFS